MGKHGVRVGGCCPVCFGQWVSLPSQAKTYCSQACRRVAERKNNWSTCGQCGDLFKTPTPSEVARGEGKYCSKACKNQGPRPIRPADPEVAQRRAARRSAHEARMAARACSVCSNVFRPRGTGQHVCVACRPKVERARASERWARVRQGRKYTKPSPATKPCATCATEYTGYPNSKYCSTGCRPSRVSGDGHRLAGKVVEPVGLRYLLRRDGGRCQICHGRVSVRRSVPHPRSPTVDHIVPLSRGGLHQKANCQLACFACNTAKGNRSAGSQLLLVG